MGDPRFSRSPCRWMWSDAEGTPFCWSRVRSAETTFKKLQRYKHCAKQVKLEIHGETKSEVVAFASVAAVLSYLGGNAIDPANGPDTSTVKAAEDDVESIQWMWGDAGGRNPLPYSERLAVENPLRWSHLQCLDVTIQQLLRYWLDKCERPVRMKIVYRGRAQSKVVVYPSVLAALCDLRGSEQGVSS